MAYPANILPRNERILNEKPHPEMGYRSCLGIIRLAQQYSAQRMEAAAERALLAQACPFDRSLTTWPDVTTAILPTKGLPRAFGSPSDFTIVQSVRWLIK